MVRKNEVVEREKKRSDDLLLNILPEEVAEELKAKGTAEAKQFDYVTVLFTDFKDFTALSEQLSPKELVADLHTCFSEFDRICEKYGILHRSETGLASFYEIILGPKRFDCFGLVNIPMINGREQTCVNFGWKFVVACLGWHIGLCQYDVVRLEWLIEQCRGEICHRCAILRSTGQGSARSNATE